MITMRNMRTTNTIKTYSELILLPTFEERFDYLRLQGKVGEETFGYDRYLNQSFYKSQEYRRVRDQIIIRDCGCDLGLEGYEIYGRIIIHHMNPITVLDILDRSDFLLNPEYLICVSLDTHNAIHYGDKNQLPQLPIERRPNDTCPWRKNV